MLRNQKQKRSYRDNIYEDNDDNDLQCDMRHLERYSRQQFRDINGYIAILLCNITVSVCAVTPRPHTTTICVLNQQSEPTLERGTTLLCVDICVIRITFYLWWMRDALRVYIRYDTTNNRQCTHITNLHTFISSSNVRRHVYNINIYMFKKKWMNCAHRASWKPQILPQPNSYDREASIDGGGIHPK